MLPTGSRRAAGNSCGSALRHWAPCCQGPRSPPAWRLHPRRHRWERCRCGPSWELRAQSAQRAPMPWNRGGTRIWVHRHLGPRKTRIRGTQSAARCEEVGRPDFPSVSLSQAQDGGWPRNNGIGPTPKGGRKPQTSRWLSAGDRVKFLGPDLGPQGTQGLNDLQAPLNAGLGPQSAATIVEETASQGRPESRVDQKPRPSLPQNRDW